MICNECKIEFIYNRDKGHRVNICRKCLVRRLRRLTKEKAVAIKGGKCIKCGYNKCMDA